MNRFSREGISDCKNCPLRDRNRVWGEGNEKAKICLIGEAPGRQEDQEKHPFVGGAGRVLNSALGGLGVFRDKIWITNVISCRPPSNEISSPEAVEAIQRCQEGFRAELLFLVQQPVLVPMGNTALQALGIGVSGITKARGSVFLHQDKSLCIPTFHPAYLMHDQKMFPIWKADFQKILDVSKEGFTFPVEKFTLQPKLKDIKDLLSRVRKSPNHLLSVDIETTGLNPNYAEIVCVGLGWSEEEAICIPFQKEYGERYWKEEEEYIVHDSLEEILSSAPLAFQNALFDVDFLEKKGFKIGKVAHDTMLLHHCIHAELPHNLGFIVSVYGKTPYWKETFNRRTTGILEMDQMELRRYNCRDCVVLHQVLPDMVADAEELEVYKTYKNISLPLIRPVLDMQNKGVLLSKSRLATWKKSLDKQIEEASKELCLTAGLPLGFNLDSDDDVRLLLYGVPSQKHERDSKNLEEYEGNEKKKRNTAKYRKILQTANVYRDTKVLCPHLKLDWVSSTEGGKYSVGEGSLSSIMLHAQQRLSLVKTFVRKEKDEEERSLGKLLDWVSLFRKYNELAKLRSTYTTYPTARDGRVHCRFLLHGTTSGRLSSRDPNLQNQPLAARRVFVAPAGYFLLARDYNNLELRVAAALSNDTVLLRVFEEGKNIHDLNTEGLFKVGKKDPHWDSFRRVAKTYVFGRRLYGGSLQGIYRKIIAESPEIRLTLSEFEKFDRVFEQMYPQLASWQAKIKKKVLATRMIRNAFGRLRIFLGTDSEIVREGLNHPVQSTAAEIKNMAIIRLHDRMKGKKSSLILDVHDELVFEVKTEEKRWMEKVTKEEMEKPVKIGDRWIVFPTEMHCGKSWGDLKD